MQQLLLAVLLVAGNAHARCPHPTGEICAILSTTCFWHSYHVFDTIARVDVIQSVLNAVSFYIHHCLIQIDHSFLMIPLDPSQAPNARCQALTRLLVVVLT